MLTELFGENSWLVILVLCMTLDIPLLVAVGFIIQRRRISASHEWTMAFGEIVESETKQVYNRQKTPSYKPHVVYEYNVDGQPHRSSRVHFGINPATSNRAEVEEQVAKYPIGQQIEVYYNPNKPSQAVLERAAPISRTTRLVVIGMLIGSIAALVIIPLALLLQSTPD